MPSDANVYFNGGFKITFSISFLVGGSDSKASPAMRETQVRSLGQEDLPGEGNATHSSILAKRIPRRKEPGELQSMGLQRVGHD